MDRARLSAALARRALIAELDLTPKPGLVDREHRGAHRDMDYERMHDGAHALEPALARIAACARDARVTSVELREEIGAIGRSGERAMLRATGGVNTHRGALWALGLLVAGEQLAGPRSAAAIAARASAVARTADRFSGEAVSNGRMAHARFGAGGARREAERGFPAALRVALPIVAAGGDPLHALIALIAVLEDTCLLHRGGPPALRYARLGARRLLASGVCGAGVEQFCRRMSAAGLSPGGSADALAAALYVQSVTAA